MSRRLILWFLAVILVFNMTACKKKDHVKSTLANLLVINASPNAGSLAVLQNLHPIGSFDYLKSFDAGTAAYKSIDSGFNQYQLKKGNDELQRFLFSNIGTHFSFVIYDTVSTGKVKSFFLQDKVDSTGFGNRSSFRFLQLSPDLDSVDVLTSSLVNGTDSTLFRIQYFGKFSNEDIASAISYQGFLTGTRTIRIRKSATGTILRNYQINFEKGGIYTLVLKGYANRNTADSLSLSVIRHN